VYEQHLLRSLLETRQNNLYLPGCALPGNVHPTAELQEAVQGAEVVIFAVPSPHLRRVCQQAAPLLRAEQILVSAAKGLERHTLLRMSEVINASVSERFEPRLAVLSGPTFAREVACGAPTAVVIASSQEALACHVQRSFANANLRFYTNADVAGVELGGAVKNVIAIAAGICDGLGLGSNTVAALITRGLSEMTRLGCALGARRETLYGLAGLGDLVLTCTGVASRNHAAGAEIGRGRTVQEVLDSTSMVIEGIYTTAATRELALRAGVEMPITEQMYAVLYAGRSPREAVRELMERTLKPE
jgi:glycerol-3-phosphate dehydrogenase (NAD(P)+)